MSELQWADVCEKCHDVITFPADGRKGPDHDCRTFENMRHMFGKMIKEVRINPAKDTLLFTMTNGDRFAFRTGADCCSETWIEHVSNAEQLAGAMVEHASEIDMPEPTEGRLEQYETKAYGLRIRLKGRAMFVLEYRNGSNGYYGGYLFREDLRSARGSNKWPLLNEDF